MRYFFSFAVSTALVALLVLGCDDNGTASEGGEGNDPDGPYTQCGYPYAVTNSGGKTEGEACSSDAECEYGVCLMPGDAGNFTNTQFGVCSRGCECANEPESQLSAAEKEVLSCIYPTDADGGRDFRYVVPKCVDLSDCPAAGYTKCGLPDHGGASKVCQAL